jgi:outer membrane protein assembly complex protein YaeT
MKKQALLLLFLLGLANALWGSDLQVPARFQLTWVRFKGVKHVSEKKLAATLAAKIPPLWKIWQRGPTLSAIDLEDDRIRIQQFYEQHGYYHSQVNMTTDISRPATSVQDASDEQAHARLPQVKVTFEVTEGDPIIVTAIEVGIDKTIDRWDEKQLREILALKTGRVFTAADYEASKKQAARFLGVRGHPFATVTGKATIDTTKNQAVAIYTIEAGPLCRFGSVDIDQADNAVAQKTIRRALTIRENAIYNVAEIEKSRENLLKLNVFRLVIFKPAGPPETEGGKVPIVLELESNSRHSVTAGIGYGTEDKLRLQGAWTYRNALGHAGNSSLEAKYSDLIESLTLNFDQPYLWDDKNRLFVTSGYEKEKFTSYTNRKILAKAGIARNLRDKVTGQLGYGLEYNDVQNIDLIAFDPDELEAFEERNKYLISAVFSQVVRDTRSNKLNPREGSLLAGSIEWASRAFGSELQYVKPAVEGRVYVPFVEKLIGSGRLRLESIQEIEQSDFIPINKRLFLGGSNTVRGYGFQEVPPLDAAGNPIGGRTALNANLELRFPVYQDFFGAVFMDAGLIDTEPFSLSVSDTWYSCGLGLRYDTIVGPLRLDFGYKLNPPTGTDIGDTDNPDDMVGDRWRIHFSIGQAF